ncbi:MAG TPA: alkaline phosphatase D family protein, partial [Acidimicrobiia bacterium]
FLGAAAAAGALAALRRGTAPAWAAGASRSPNLASDPFTLGVASGDPLDDAIVLWTRLAPDPLAPDGGMTNGDVDVEWELLDGERTRVVASGTAVAAAELGHSVHVDARGLDPDRPYRYRFMVGDYETPIAHTRTAPAPDAGRRLRMGHVSCQMFEEGYYTAYADIAADEDLDLVAHCGDYIYESPTGGEVRTDPLPEAVTIDDYRARYALYRSDADLRAAHARCPWVITWDDHEVENNYHGDTPEDGSTTPGPADFAARRAAAYQAWWEHMPVRFDPPGGPDLRIHRRVRWGRLADLLVLDTRQYRTDQVCAEGSDIGPRCDAAFTDDFTMLGAEQERWLDRQLPKVAGNWTVLVQGIAVMQWRFAPGNAVWNLDGWDGYPAARDRLMASLLDTRAPNPVVLTGDVHSSWVGALQENFDDPSAQPLGTEHIAPGVTSPPSGLLRDALPAVLENSPHIRWAEADHTGWVRHDVTPGEWRTEYRLVDDVTVPGSAVTVASRWLTPDGGAVAEA